MNLDENEEYDPPRLTPMSPFQTWWRMSFYSLKGILYGVREFFLWMFVFPFLGIFRFFRLFLHRSVMLVIGGAQCPSCKLVYKFGIWRARKMDRYKAFSCPYCDQTIIGMHENAPFDIQ